MIAVVLACIAAGLLLYFVSFGVESRWAAAGLLTVGCALVTIPGLALL